MALTRQEAAAFEAWKTKETERARQAEQHELRALGEKLEADAAAKRAKISKDWDDKDARIANSFARIETMITDYLSAAQERKSLQRQLETLEHDNDQLKQIPVDNSRQERLVRINNLRLEIQKLEEDLTRSDAELRAANESKNRYKRLFLESNKVVAEMVQEQQKQQKAKMRRKRT